MLDEGEEQAVTEFNKINSIFVSIKKDNQLTNHIQFLEDQLQIKLMLMEHLTKQEFASCVSMQYTDRKSTYFNIILVLIHLLQVRVHFLVKFLRRSVKMELFDYLIC